MATRRRRTVSKTLTKEAVSQEIKTIALLGAGMLAGSLGANVLNKMLKIDATDTRMSLKKFVPPLVLTGAGTVGAIKLEGEVLRNISKGIAISGVLAGAKLILPKAVLNGMEGFNGLGENDAFGEPMGGDMQNIPVYYEPENNVLQLSEGRASMGAYEPELPELEARQISGTISYPEEDQGATADLNSLDNPESVAFEEIL